MVKHVTILNGTTFQLDTGEVVVSTQWVDDAWHVLIATKANVDLI